MRLRTFTTIACLALLLLPGVAGTQHASDEISVEVTAIAGGSPIEDRALNRSEVIHVIGDVSVPERNNTAWRVWLNTTVDGANAQTAFNQSSTAQEIRVPLQTRAPLNETPSAALAWDVTVQSRNLSTNTTGNQTSHAWVTEATETGQITFSVAAPEVPAPPPGIPWTPILIIGAVIAVGGAGAYWWVTRDRQIRSHQPRSKAMAELEGEKYKGAGAQESAEPEIHPQLKILEARAEDIRRMIELAKDRHERGDLTEHQYNTIRERKEAELEELEEEMDQYRES